MVGNTVNTSPAATYPVISLVKNLYCLTTQAQCTHVWTTCPRLLTRYLIMERPEV